jgi:hypothetical protein
MRLEEMYEHFGRSWITLMRATGIGNSTLALWRRKGFIPANSQLKLEKRLNGLFRADLSDAMPHHKRID